MSLYYMVIKHAVIDFVDPQGKKYYPSDSVMAANSFVGSTYTQGISAEEQSLAAHILIDQDPNKFQITLYRLDSILPQDRRLSEIEKRAFIIPENIIAQVNGSLSGLDSWRNYLKLVRGKQVHETPKLTEKYNQGRTAIHDCVAQDVNDALANKGLEGVQSRRFIAMLRTYTLNRQEQLTANDPAP